MHQFDDVNFSSDEQNDQSVPKNGQIVRKDTHEPSHVTIVIDGIISPVEVPADGNTEQSVFAHIEEHERNKQRPYVLNFVMALWGFTMVSPILAPAFSPEMQNPTPAHQEIVFRTQALMTIMFSLCILLYYFQNPQLLSALERVANKIVEQSRK